MPRNSTQPPTFSAKMNFDDQMDDSHEEAQDDPTQKQGKNEAGEEIEQHSRSSDIESQISDHNPQKSGGFRSKFVTEHQALYLAALRNDWKAAEPILTKHPSYAGDVITRRDETVLHVAAAARSTKFVQELLKVMDKEYLKQKNGAGSTAFCFAAVSGVVEIARALIGIDKNLASLRGEDNMPPITMAALFRNKEMVSYLFEVTRLEGLEQSEKFNLLKATIQSEMYDLALDMVKEDSTLATYRYPTNSNYSILNMLAKKSVKISSPNPEGKRERFIHMLRLNSGIGRICSPLWERFITAVLQIPYILWLQSVREHREKYLLKKKAGLLLEKLWEEWVKLPEEELMKRVSETNILHSAAKEGNAEFLALIICEYPDFLWEVNIKRQTIFHVAVLHRQEKVFSLLQQIGAIKDLITLLPDEDENNILHSAGMLGQPIHPTGTGKQGLGEKKEKIMPPSFLRVSGAALRLQKELVWFKEVEKIVPPVVLRKKNKAGKTPKQLFSEEHQSLLKEGETWMKDTANYCMIVATLIATVMFASAFTVPGGNNDDKGTPIMLKLKGFTVFVISDAVALFSSIVSIIMFLSILTSRYTEDDFLVSLPAKLLCGLTTLFASIVSMLVAFAATFFLVYNNHMAWEPMLIAAFASVPIALFAFLHFKLWLDTAKSTYWSKSLFTSGKHKLY